MIALSLFQAAAHDILKFPGVISGRCLRRHVKMCFDDVMNIPQHHGGTLLYAFRCGQVKVSASFHNGFCFSGTKRVFDLIAPDVGKANWCTYTNPVHNPSHARVPVNGFQNSSGGGRRHYIITDTLHFHFRSGKAGVVAPDLNRNGHFHSPFYCLFGFSLCFSILEDNPSNKWGMIYFSQINSAFPGSADRESPFSGSYRLKLVRTPLSSVMGRISPASSNA